ncbi:MULTISPECIES: DUF1697 domain-containing protein [unclassified Nocardioides]|uniref:DUF1697 domain-containing protein n=1 Tax=unclassified Nocardioides TaxID=2615069 RepID=UPI003618554C
MATYVAFLRAINLGAKRKFAKASIAAAVEKAGFTGVETYINTGNVRFDTSLRSRARIEAALEEAFAAEAGFEVPTMVFTKAEVRTIAADAAELGADRELERHFVYLLKSEPEVARVDALAGRSTDVNEVVVRGRAAHLLLGAGYVQGTVDPFGVEKALGVAATNRNLTVIRTLAEKWC